MANATRNPNEIRQEIDRLHDYVNEAETLDGRNEAKAEIGRLYDELAIARAAFDPDADGETRYIRIPVTGSPESMRNSSTLEDLQEAVGGYLETIVLTNGHVIYINDYRWNTNMRVNPLVSALAGRLLCGDAVITGWPDSDGNDGAIKPEIEEMILKTING